MRYLLCFTFTMISIFGVRAAAPVGTNISNYPNTNVAPASALLIMAVTNQSPRTNYNIKVSDFLAQATNGLATTSFVNTIATTVSNGVITEIITASNSLAGNGFARLEIQTNTVRLGLVTNINWTYGMTGSVSSATAILGVDDSLANNSVSNGLLNIISTTSNFIFTTLSLAGTTNFMNLSVQAAKLPNTNYPTIDAGWQAWETVYAETNAEGSRVSLDASWQLVIPPDYATNSLQLLINYSLLNTNGPNTSNVIFGVSCLPIRSGTTNNVHTNAFGFTVWGTNDWIAKYDGTNIVTNLVISIGTNASIAAQDLSVLKVSRDAVNDTFGGAVSVHGLQLLYTRQ